VLRFRRITVLILLAISSGSLCLAAAFPKPKLVVGIIIDQFRYDYLTRFRSDYRGGFDQFLTRGADFTNAFYGQVPTKTAVGHSIFMSGAMPAVSGIIENAWYDRDEKQVVTSVCDWTEKTVGGEQAAKEKKCTDSDPASPRRMLVTTIGDELRAAHNESKVIGISLKARAAILPAGHAANGVFWFDDVSGNFVSSTFYMQQLPDWADRFNRKKLPAKYVLRKWDGFPEWKFQGDSKAPYAQLPASPWGNELVEEFAEQAIAGEKLGQRGSTDLLTVSFSSNDYVGHAVGPYAPEVRDMSVRTDQLLGKLFRVLDEKVGLADVVIVLSADHGVAPTPQQDAATRAPGGYLGPGLEKQVAAALNELFGTHDWFAGSAGEASLYLNRDAVAQAKTADGRTVTTEEVLRAAKEALLADPRLHVSRVYSRDQLDNGLGGDFVALAVANGYYPRRSGDLSIVFEPGFMAGSHGTTHFSPYAYDRHVPVLFMGAGIKAGRYDATIQPNDIAPTLATMLDIQTPSGSSGRVLTEMLAQK